MWEKGLEVGVGVQDERCHKTRNRDEQVDHVPRAQLALTRTVMLSSAAVAASAAAMSAINTASLCSCGYDTIDPRARAAAAFTGGAGSCTRPSSSAW